jgi:MinD-like ATPase involved in chromosome partitioning or flagellar assembly
LLVLAIHSYRGGTGKTLLATNLAAMYTKKEKVCLLDYDLRAPSLHNMFKGVKPNYWINDLLNGDCEVEDCLHKIDSNLWVGFSCPDSEALRELMGKSSNWEREALKKTLTMKKTLQEKGFQKIIFDTSPGLAYSSINAIVGSDVIALVMRLDASDIRGTKEMVKGVYELLEKPTFNVVNMVLPSQQVAYSSLLEANFGKDTLAYIPCLCDVKSLIAQGKDIMIDEKNEYSEAVIKLSNEINIRFNR